MGLFDKLKKAPTQKDTLETSSSLENPVTFIENSGGCMITKSLLSGKSNLKWIFRENSVNDVDNGWRALGDSDTQEYINDNKNHVVVSFNTLANLEPAVLSIFHMSIGTDLEFHYDETGRYFTDNNTGKRIK